jgi:hypothetical protein
MNMLLFTVLPAWSLLMCQFDVTHGMAPTAGTIFLATHAISQALSTCCPAVCLMQFEGSISLWSLGNRIISNGRQVRSLQGSVKGLSVVSDEQACFVASLF